MSFVGTRPEVVKYVKKYKPEYFATLLLPAGITSEASKKKNIPFVYCLQDIFPDSLVNAKMTSKGSWIWKLGRKIENYTYKNADEIITISDAFKQAFI